MRTKAKLSLLMLSLITAASLSLPVLAEGTNGSTSGSSTGNGGSSNTTTENHTPLITAVGAHEPTKSTTETIGTAGSTSATGTDHHFAGDKLKLCQTRETTIDGIMGRLGDRGQKQLDLFTTIATRVETFYKKSGKTLDNYDTLVAAVNTAKDNGQTAVDQVKADKANFKCDGTDPSGAATSFKTDLQTEITALKNYRTAIKNLIVGVKSVIGTTGNSQSSGGTH